MSDDADRELGEDLILSVAFILSEANKPITPEDIAAYLLRAMYPDGDYETVMDCGRQIYYQAKELLG